MASTSDLPPAGGGEGEETTAAASAPEPSPPPPPPPPPKRRWSPCTWRYAIEDSQPELGSRQRLYNSGASSALRSGSEQQAAPASCKSRPPNRHQDHAYGKDYGEPRHSSHSQRGTDSTELRSKHSRSSHEMSNKRKRTPPPREELPHHFSSLTNKQSPNEDDEEANEAQEEDEVDGDEGHHAEEGKERRKRKMSPSELYFCEICRARAEAEKSSTADHPNPSSHKP